MLRFSFFFLIDNAVPASNMVKYRVLYAFESRNPDELSVMPGDDVLVNIEFTLFKIC